MKKSELLFLLNEIGASPRKSLSQNFLIDANIIKKLVTLADVQAGDSVLEIGPGPGGITTELLLSGANVIAVEKDKLFAQHLPHHPNLTTHCEDILKFPFETLKGFKVVSNVPFHITAPILEKLCIHSHCFQSFTLIVQKEVALKIQAKQSSYLGLLLQFYTTLKATFAVPPSCYYPSPLVDTAIVHLNVHTPPKIDPTHFFSIIQLAFQQRRKMISSSLRTLYPNISELLESLSLSPKARPEELSLNDWLKFIGKIDSTSL